MRRCNKCRRILPVYEYVNGGTCLQCIRQTWGYRLTRVWRKVKAFVSRLLPKHPPKYLSLADYARATRKYEDRDGG